MLHYWINDRLALKCFTKNHSLFCEITTNLPDLYLENIEEGFINPVVKSNGLYNILIKEGIIKEVIKCIEYESRSYDLVRFDLSKLKDYNPSGYEEYMLIHGKYDELYPPQKEEVKEKSLKYNDKEISFLINALDYNWLHLEYFSLDNEILSRITIKDIAVNSNHIMQYDEAFIDPIVKSSDLYQLLIDEGIIKKVIKKNLKCYTNGKCDLVKFDLEKLKEYDPKGYENYLKVKIDNDKEIIFKI